MEKIDPYFKHRKEQAKAHKAISNIDISEYKKREAKENKNLANPVIIGDIEEFGWSQKAVDNIIDAYEKGFIKIEKLTEEKIRIEFLPILNLPKELGHVCERQALIKNLKSQKDVFGDSDNQNFTYLQTTDFAVEGYMDDEQEGTEYARVFINTDELQKKRNIYLDPESLHITDYEYGHAFCVFGGVPYNSLDHVEIIKAKKIAFQFQENEEWIEDPKKEMNMQAERLRIYLKNIK